MIISDKKRFVFVHIYKTAGTSITEVLMPHARLVEKIAGYYPTRYGVATINRLFGLRDEGSKWINGVHKHATAEEIERYLGKRYSDYFKFAFVRHPLDWQVSLYEFIKKSHHRDNKIVKNLTFKEFVLREIENGAKRQWDFVSNRDTLIVDYIGKKESITNDFYNISEKIDIPRRRVPYKNRSPRKAGGLSEYYDNELRDAVVSYYSVDFVQFDYEVDQ